MQLGVDFDGTVYRYRVCRKLDQCGASIFAEETTLEAAQKTLKSIMKTDKKCGKGERYRYWIMKETRHFVRVFDTEQEEQP